jgi:hypothetical protein
MRSRLLNFAAIASLLLLVAAGTMWARSRRMWEWAAHQTDSGRLYTVTSRFGALDLDVTDGWRAGTFRPLELHSDSILIDHLDAPSEWSALGFGVNRRAQTVGVQGGWSAPSSGTSLIVPYWSLCVAAPATPAAVARSRMRRWRRRRSGRCVECGYDLRGTPERCPECGAARGGALIPVS